MFEKIKQMINKIPYGLIPMVVVGICTVIGTIITFLVYYKAPISLNNEKDKTAIFNLIQEQHPACEILNVELSNAIVLYPETFEILYTKSNQILNEEDAFWYTRAVNYDVIIDNVTTSYQLVFEITEKFLREEVGQFLFVADKESKVITY